MQKTVKISEVKVNPNNPRLIKDEKFKKLVQSIKDFPEMLNIRPIVVNKEMIILGGNMRYKACVEVGLKEIPIIVTDLTEEQQKEFLIKDNVSGGEWDWDVLANEWNDETLSSWGIDFEFNKDIDQLSFKDKMSLYGDHNCLYPIVPKYDEKQELFIIISENEIDANWLREKLGMQKMSSYKNSEISKSNIIHINDLKDVL
jgi:hypothetical protein